MTSGTKIGVALGVVAALGLAGVAAFYSLAGDAGNGSCKAARQTAARMTPLAKGEVAAVEIRKDPQPAPELAFTGPDGQPMTLAALKGKTLLVNLWATWCAPCLKEMPALDALQKAMGGPDFAVVAINIDTRNLDKPKAWLAENKVTALPFYGDPQAATFQALRAAHKVEGMPVSIIVDRQGCELGILQGPADWASADSKALMAAATGR
ncbi:MULTISPECIES: TlpA disulfide reductase family protein [unclassified Bosea (in: a-proteobacteria)]|uniref:thiol:disulfide interchange protein TlpA n=1 Tax=unclassified Bosea (in: a-proteobacteria) TaxID=2653178 RepID=UPI000954698C|nr:MULTISPECIES: TlpA disulfide reductase family protein [unclassified Bosea (in: a-proteobacteria)]TAJ34466.1 MAG: TlpA family protein disulfide reductase [Bosea sp. (in: a-proteobacteria)]SIQ60758.1 Thiol-disulfide isomerase or thioredoxin [Bosea sp. TND4EK4]